MSIVMLENLVYENFPNSLPIDVNALLIVESRLDCSYSRSGSESHIIAKTTIDLAGFNAMVEEGARFTIVEKNREYKTVIVDCTRHIVKFHLDHLGCNGVYSDGETFEYKVTGQETHIFEKKWSDFFCDLIL